MKMNAVILAGGTMSPDDPLYSEGPDGSRCLIDVAGKPMVQWVIEALDASDSIQELYVIGLSPGFAIKSQKPLHYLPDHGSLFDNIHIGVTKATEDPSASQKAMIASGDLPAIRPEMVDWLADQVNQDPSMSLYYNVITQSTMESRFPNANRSFVKLKDLAVCGGDLNVADRDLFDSETPIWHKLAEARKSPLKQVRLLGFGNLILVALRLVSLKGAVRRVCKKLGVRGTALICPYAEMAMDADKPHQLEILRNDLSEAL